MVIDRAASNLAGTESTVCAGDVLDPPIADGIDLHDIVHGFLAEVMHRERKPQ
jgi:hypothetical protein